MRELTKSMLRLSWAMPLFGIRQLASLSLPTQTNRDRAAQGFDALTGAAERELGGAFGSLYETGDRLQSGIVDAMFDVFDPRRWLPGGAPEEPIEPPAASPAADGEDHQGWGPVPES